MSLCPNVTLKVTILQHLLPAPREIINLSMRIPVETCVSPSLKRKKGHDHTASDSVDTLTSGTDWEEWGWHLVQVRLGYSGGLPQS